MIETRVLSTLKLFDFQEVPLTLLELHKFLLQDASAILSATDSRFELTESSVYQDSEIALCEILEVLDALVFAGRVETSQGYYVLPGKKVNIEKRLRSYQFGIERERRIARFLPYTKYIPFIRGIAVGGSQALGIEREESDIDLLVITHPKYIWTARTFLTFYFHILGVRRYKHFITNRFCLNHYIAGNKLLTRDKNLYTAMEYARLRGVVYGEVIEEFKIKNQDWERLIFPHLPIYNELLAPTVPAPLVQRWTERLLTKIFGSRLEEWLANWQVARIKKDELILVGHDELSFHHVGKQKRLLVDFYDYLSNMVGPKLEVVVVTETVTLEGEVGI